MDIAVNNYKCCQVWMLLYFQIFLSKVSLGNWVKCQQIKRRNCTCCDDMEDTDFVSDEAILLTEVVCLLVNPVLRAAVVEAKSACFENWVLAIICWEAICWEASTSEDTIAFPKIWNWLFTQKNCLESLIFDKENLWKVVIHSFFSINMMSEILGIGIHTFSWFSCNSPYACHHKSKLSIKKDSTKRVTQKCLKGSRFYMTCTSEVALTFLKII